ncbi:MAG: HEAT repeat domain-containing protein [Candidatus Odinarchaeota archaeon]
MALRVKHKSVMLEQNKLPEEIFQRREEFGIDNSIKLLTNIIETEKNENKRRGAVKYLGLVSKEAPSLKKECFATLENILISGDSIEIKCEAAKALGKLEYDKALKPLTWVLEENPDNLEIRLSVLKAIKKIQFLENEIKLFIKELGSPFTSIRDYVRNKLLTLNPEELINALVVALKTEEFSDEHKSELIKLIGIDLSMIDVSFEDASFLKLKYPEVLSDLLSNKHILLNEITQILKEEDSELMDAILTIVKLLKNEIKNEIIKLILIDDFIVKKNAIKLTGKLRLTDAVDLLVTNLDNIYNEVSIASIKALGEIGDMAAIPDLLGVLDIEDVSFEYTDLDMKLFILDAIKNIYLINNEANYDNLYSYLEKDNDTLKESVAFIFGELGKENFVDPLINLLHERNLDVKKNAIIALGKIGNLKALDQLIRILDDKDSYWLIKKVSVDAIYNIFHKNWYKLKEDEKDLKRELNKNLAMLIEHLKINENEDFKVKLSLIKFLEAYGGEKALDALLKRVNDFNRVVRIHASNAIKRIEEKLELEKSA